MKVLHIHVGNELIPDVSLPSDYYLQRNSFHDGQLKYYSKWDIVNADTQMHSIQQKGIDVIYGHLSDRRTIKALWRAGWRLRKVCKEEKVDIVHVFWGNTTAFMTTLFSPKPVVISFSGSDLIGSVDAKGEITNGGKVSRLLSQLAGLMATRIITKSEDMKRHLWSNSRKKATAIPNGLNLEKFSPQDIKRARLHLGWDMNKKYIIFFDGGGAVVKDTPLARQAFDIVNVKMPHAELMILKGIVHDELPYYYNAADAMLITSFHEGSNNSLKEARACNLPIVSVNVGDVSERLQNVSNTYVVDNRNAVDIADKLILVLQSNARSNGSAYSQDVSLDTIADKIINVYKSIKNKI